jgi:sugar O-acyltransferase (sialic acid O-acetyltransferase NeuD family)
VALDDLEKRFPPTECSMFVAVGYNHLNKTRAKLYGLCKAMGYSLASYISSTATHYGEIEVGDNCLILEKVVIQPFVKIGNNVIVWCGCLLGHDVVIGDHCFVSAATIAGNVTVGPYCFIGVNATLRDGIKVGAESVIGAGALLLKDAPPGSVYRGVEAVRASFPSSRLRAI